MSNTSTRQPIFVLCAARTGSTLLRLVLDSHPKIHAPGESNLAGILRSFQKTYQMVRNEDTFGGADGEIDQESVSLMRQLIDGIMRPTNESEADIRWCDKSLVNWESPELLLKVWPEAKFICLHRHLMDFIYSATEASPWGFQVYGFAPYIARHSDNFPLALCEYWMDRTRAMLEFENKHPDICSSVRYEDLVTDPSAVSEALWEFLGLVPNPLSLSNVFGAHHRGPSDHKVWFTREIHQDSVGRGTAVPIESIPEASALVGKRLLATAGVQPANWYMGFVWAYLRAY